MASVSLGLFIWPPACQLLIDSYGWRGAFIIMGGVQLNGIVFSALIRPITPPPMCTGIDRVTSGSDTQDTAPCTGDDVLREQPDSQGEEKLRPIQATPVPCII